MRDRKIGYGDKKEEKMIKEKSKMQKRGKR